MADRVHTAGLPFEWSSLSGGDGQTAWPIIKNANA